MKKIAMLILGLAMTATSFAQFQQDKLYAGASLSGLNLSYDSNKSWNMDLSANAGYLFERDWMVTANAEFDWHKNDYNKFQAGVGLRYYIESNGIYVGGGVNYVHADKTYDDFMPTVHVGYAFFLNRTVTVEPQIYYNQSLKDHSQYSGFGFRLGFGIYFE